MKIIINTLFYITLVTLFVSCNKTERKINFNDDEIKYINSIDKIILTIDIPAPPHAFIKDGIITGTLVEQIKLIEQRIGVPIELEGTSWKYALNKALNHEVDGIVDAAPTRDRKLKLNFTDYYFREAKALLIKNEVKLRSKLTEYNDIKIAVKMNSNHKTILSEKIPVENIVEFATLNDAYHLLSRNQVKGIYGNWSPLNNMIKTRNMNDVKIGLKEYVGKGGAFGLRNDKVYLLSIFNKAIRDISQKEKDSIIKNFSY